MSKKVLLLLSTFAVMFTAPLAAQVPLATATPEGTVITNNVSVAYQDANGNSYSPATASVTVTVGFVAFVDVTGTTTYTPSSPSSGNNAVFVLNNFGNGIDSMSVGTATSTGVTITGYIYNSTPYASLALLNAALAGVPIAQQANISVTVVYSVGSLYGGQTIPLSLTATSRRDAGKNDTQTDNISPPVAGGVSVTATTSMINRLVTGSQPAYTTTFTVSNGANATRTFTLSGGSSAGAVTFGSITGGTSVTIPQNSSVTITVSYTVNNVAAGSTANVTLTATADDDNLITATGTHQVTVIKAALTLTKEAYRADKTTPITSSPTDVVLPGEDIWYKMTITNNGLAPATALTLTDALPASTTYVAYTASGSWGVVNSAGTITATLTGTLAPSASDVIWIRVTIK